MSNLLRNEWFIMLYCEFITWVIKSWRCQWGGLCCWCNCSETSQKQFFKLLRSLWHDELAIRSKIARLRCQWCGCRISNVRSRCSTSSCDRMWRFSTHSSTFSSKYIDLLGFIGFRMVVVCSTSATMWRQRYYLDCVCKSRGQISQLSSLAGTSTVASTLEG